MNDSRFNYMERIVSFHFFLIRDTIRLIDSADNIAVNITRYLKLLYERLSE